MVCPSCHAEDTRVIDTRVIEDGGAVRRRRSCEQCGFRFSTLEEIEILALRVVKADGREEAYDKDKLVRSVRLPTQKRPISPARFKRLISMIEQDIQTRARADHMTSQQIGEIVMKHLKRLDKIAYIRFAAVYQSFDDLTAFAEALEQLKPRRKTGGKRVEKKKK